MVFSHFILLCKKKLMLSIDVPHITSLSEKTKFLSHGRSSVGQLGEAWLPS